MKDKSYWLWLSGIKGIGSKRMTALIEYFETAEAVYHCTRKQLQTCGILDEKTIDAILSNKKIEKADNYLYKMKENDIKVYTINDEGYPENLKNIYDPPPLLYVKGDIKKTDGDAIAVVGSRKASEYGLKAADKFGSMLAEAGITVISGLALGIDSAAHKGALKGNGRTIAVLGGGLGHIYPRCHYGLSCEIAKRGALISEYPFDAEARPEYFPARNRIISGLALGVLIVEAGRRSGSLITSDFALEQGREVFSIPGNINSPGSKGTNWLIKNGAKLVDSLEDILEEINLKYILPEKKDKTASEMTDMTVEEGLILCYLQTAGKTVESIIQELKLPAGKVMSCLTLLELKGMVTQNNGCYFAI